MYVLVWYKAALSLLTDIIKYTEMQNIQKYQIKIKNNNIQK